VLVVVNTARLELVEGVLGQRFDVRIDAASPDALPRLRDVLLARRDFERAGAFGAGAGALELTAGSLVHGAKIPFGGLGMASAQAAVLTRAAAAMNDRARVVWVALLAAGLKSMSPAGQRIGPMVAIAIQGFLYSRALRWLGWNRFAVGVGGFLIGVWVSVQGLLLPWLLLGNALVAGLQGLAGEVARWFGFTAPPLLPLLAAWVLVHGVVGCCATMLAWRQRRDGLPAMPTLGGGLDFESTRDRGWRRALGRGSRDLLRPAFWVPVVLVLCGLLLAGETTRSLLAVALRALVVGWVLFVLVQRIDFSALPARLRILGHWGPAIAWRRALSRLQRSRA
jgi:hypothetical protein